VRSELLSVEHPRIPSTVSVFEYDFFCQSMYLQEDLSKDPICFLPEDRREYDGNSIVAGLDIDCFLLSVVDCTCRASLQHTLRGRLGSVLGCFLLQLMELVKCLLERCGHSIALEERYPADQVILCFYTRLAYLHRLVLKVSHLDPLEGSLNPPAPKSRIQILVLQCKIHIHAPALPLPRISSILGSILRISKPGSWSSLLGWRCGRLHYRSRKQPGRLRPWFLYDMLATCRW
jgi:hypothetical protein